MIFLRICVSVVYSLLCAIISTLFGNATVVRLLLQAEELNPDRLNMTFTSMNLRVRKIRDGILALPLIRYMT